MMTSELKNIIENIAHARMLEIKTGVNLPVIIDRIAKAKRKEAEAKKVIQGLNPSLRKSA